VSTALNWRSPECPDVPRSWLDLQPWCCQRHHVEDQPLDRGAAPSVHPVPCAYLKEVLTRLPAMTNRQLPGIIPAKWGRSHPVPRTLAAQVS
jgi:hypothetical protein